MAVIVSGGDGATPRVPGPKGVAVKAIGRALASPRQKAVRNAVGGYQPTGVPSIVSGNDQTVRSQGTKPSGLGRSSVRLPKGASIVSGGDTKPPRLPKMPQGATIISGGG